MVGSDVGVRDADGELAVAVPVAGSERRAHAQRERARVEDLETQVEEGVGVEGQAETGGAAPGDLNNAEAGAQTELAAVPVGDEAFVRAADREVVVAVAVEVAGRESGAEAVIGLAVPPARDIGLLVEAVGDGGEAEAPAAQDVYRAAVEERAGVILIGGSDRQIEVTIGVEVPEREGAAEVVAGLRRVGDVLRILGDAEVPGVEEGTRAVLRRRRQRGEGAEQGDREAKAECRAHETLSGEFGHGLQSSAGRLRVDPT